MSKFLTLLMTCAFVVAFTGSSFAVGDAAKGKELFNSKKGKCKTCHRVKNDKAKIGPGLKTVIKRRGADWVKSWLTDPKAKFDSKDAADVKNIDDILKNRLKKPKKRSKYKPKMPKNMKKLRKKIGTAWIDDMVAYFETL